jgi:ribosome maturation factor RimP
VRGGLVNTDQVAALVLPLAEAAGLLLYDVEQKGATLRISIDGPEGVPFAALERLSREISLSLDEADASGGSYLLEVSTPGVERNLRSTQHFSGAVGETVTIKTLPGPEGRQRYRGDLVAVDDDVVTIDDEERGEVRVPVHDVESARTIFEWGPAPKRGKAASSNTSHRSTP